MKTTRTPSSQCLKCGSKLDAHANMGDASPQPGDISVCAYCFTISKFDSNLDLQPLTRNELTELKKNEQVWSLIDSAITALKIARSYPE